MPFHLTVRVLGVERDRVLAHVGIVDRIAFCISSRAHVLEQSDPDKIDAWGK